MFEDSSSVKLIYRVNTDKVREVMYQVSSAGRDGYRNAEVVSTCGKNKGGEHEGKIHKSETEVQG